MQKLKMFKMKSKNLIGRMKPVTKAQGTLLHLASDGIGLGRICGELTTYADHARDRRYCRYSAL